MADRRRVLIAFASPHGTMAEVASLLADALQSAGLEVDVQRADAPADVSWYDAVIVGSAIYMGRWRSDALDFLRRHRRALAQRPVWLIHVGSGETGADPFEQRLPDGVRMLAVRIGVQGSFTVGSPRSGSALVDPSAIRLHGREIASALAEHVPVLARVR